MLLVTCNNENGAIGWESFFVKRCPSSKRHMSSKKVYFVQKGGVRPKKVFFVKKGVFRLKSWLSSKKCLSSKKLSFVKKKCPLLKNIFSANKVFLGDKFDQKVWWKKLGIRNCVGRSTGSMVGNYCFGITFFHKVGVKKLSPKF